MMRWIIGSSLNLRRVVLVAAAGAFFLGITQLGRTPVDTLPEFGPPTVEVQTEALGLSAIEVEQLITVPMEQDLLNGVAYLDTIRSESVPGLSSIELIFEPGTDLFNARQVVQERLSQAHALPQVSKPPQMLQPLSSTNRVMMIRLTPETVSMIDLSVLTRWTVRPRLMGVPGVANVSVWGQRDLQLQVQIDPERLKAAGVTLHQVIETTGNSLWASPLTFLEASTPGTGGFIDTPNQRLTIQHLQPIKTADQLAQVVIEGTGSKLRLGDVAQVVQNHQPLIGDAVFAEGAGLLLVVEKFPEADTLQVTEDLESALASLGPGLTGIAIDSTIYRPATSIKRSLGNLSIAMLVGFGLALLLLWLLLFDLRRVLIVAVTVPLSITVAYLVLRATGTTFNAMTFAGMALALVIVVDDAIAGSERLVRDGSEAGEGRRTVVRVALDSTLRARGPAAYALAIVLLSLVPLAVLDGIAGALLPALALSFALAIAASMLVALTVTPALGLMMASKKPARPSPVTERLARGYGGFLTRIVGTPGPAVLGIGVIAAGIIALPFLGATTVPNLKERDFLIELDASPGTSLPEMNRISSSIAAELGTIPGVRNVGAHVGRAVLGDQVVGVSSGELWVSVSASADYDATVAAVREVVNGYPGLDVDMLTHSREQLTEVLTGVDAPIHARVYGTDLTVLRSKAEEVRRAMAEVDGVVAPTIELDVQEPTLEVEVDLAAAQRFGIKPGDVRRAAAALLSGIEVGSLFEEQKIFEVVVWGRPEIRNSPSSVLELPIDRPGGGTVRLGDVASVRLVPNPTVIVHEAVSRSIDIVADVQGRDLDAVTRDLERRLDGITFPLEYHTELLGDHAAQQDAKNRLIAFAIAAAIGVFLLLQVCFGSWRLAAVVFAALPMALSGGSLALLATGRIASLGSIAAFFAVLGIAVRGALSLVGHLRELDRDGPATDAGVVVRGAVQRFAPAFATTAAIAALFLPVAITGPTAGNELVQPMAIVILGGVGTSALLNLFVVPFLYLRFGGRSAVDPAAELLESFRRDIDRAPETTRVIVLEPDVTTTGVGTLAVETPDASEEAQP
ncbi:MAG: efflux RND transporter permease subunit [Actinomycetota bacterium]